ncbi:hypothetical protein J2129_001515 [Methanofollis sp. W23]|uniref:DUF2341 domain-containing protein n=1 Tax=Methanofollis sp. W23 TaxID=2817849 RepID=UPI001AE75D56|nr:DUF2341 domain-containing protein [Methanofollis sp. W23]MBP2146061.1 hypothetical protein [Methanofollis sp. W23]
MDLRERGAGLVLFFLLVLAFCALLFGESGCVFVDHEKTREIAFEAWRSECREWTTQADFVNCTPENVDVHLRPGSVTLALKGSGKPLEPRAVVGEWSPQQWAGPEVDRDVGNDVAAPPPIDLEDEPSPSPTDLLADPDPSLENETAANTSMEDGEEGGGGKGSEHVSAPDQSTRRVSAQIMATQMNATAANLTVEEELIDPDGVEVLSPAPVLPAAGEEDGNDDDPLEVLGCNKSAGEIPVREPAGQEMIGEYDPVLAPSPPAAGIGTEVTGAGGRVWKRCAPVTIINPGGLLTDYQVRVEVLYSKGMKNDFRNIRFTNTTGQESLPHWCEGYEKKSSAVFWVRVPSIPSGNSTIYILYWNKNAQSASNGTATFLFYDDFGDTTTGSLDRWTSEGTIETEVFNDGGNYVLKVSSPLWNGPPFRDDLPSWIIDNGGYLIADHNESWDNIAVRERIKLDGGSIGVAGITARYESPENHLSAYVLGSFTGISGCTEGRLWLGEIWDVPWDQGTWHTEELGLSGGRADLSVDGDWLGSTMSPENAPEYGKTGLYVLDIIPQYRDEHIVRRYCPVYGGYHQTGTLTSDVFDTGDTTSKWDSLAWDADLPARTEIAFAVRASNNSNAFSGWIAVGNTSPVSADALPQGRYLQWRATLSTADETQTPILEEVRVWYTPGGS